MKFQLLEDLKELPKLKAEHAALTERMAGYDALEQALNASLAESKELQTKLSEATSNHTALEAEKAKISADFEAYKAKEGERNAAYAATNIADVARKPLAVNVKDEGNKPDFSKLSGLDRAKAAHLAQNKTK